MYCFNQSAWEKSKNFCVNMLSVPQKKNEQFSSHLLRYYGGSKLDIIR